MLRHIKRKLRKWQNLEATTPSQTRWTSGDTIRAAISSVNKFSAASMNKYIATLANGGTRYKMHPDR